MSKALHKPQYTLLSFSMTSSFASVQVAFELVQKFSTTCETLLVNAPAENAAIKSRDSLNWGIAREAVIKRGAAMTGIETIIRPVSFEDSLSHFKFSPTQNVLMLLQPDHPLERQSPSFIQLNQEVYQSPSLVIYMPDDLHQLGDYILFVGGTLPKSGYSLAKSFSDQSQLSLKQMDNPGSLTAMQSFLLSQPPSQRPALLMISSGDYRDAPMAFFKFAALTGVPVAIIPDQLGKDSE